MTASQYPVAYILKMFPRFSETFILAELLELERQGMNIRIYSLKRPNDRLVHADVARVRAPITYLPEITWRNLPSIAKAHLRVFGWNRRRYIGLLARTVRRHRWGAVKRFVQAGIIAPDLRDAGIRHVHSHFASSATSAAWYLNQLDDIGYSFTAHAKDIYIETVAQDVLRRKIERARFVVTVSDYNQAHLSTISAAAPVTRIYNGLDLIQFSPNGTRPEAPPLVLGVGRLVEKKGFADLVRACAILRDQGVAFRCQIVGTGDQELALRALIAELELEAIVTLTGPLPREHLVSFYPRASVVVAPCVIGRDGNRDGLPTVLIEAMALGVPVISTDVTGIPELVVPGETGRLVPQHDPCQLARAMRDAIEQRSCSAAMAAAGRTRVQERFDLRQNVASLKALLEEAVGR
jgi:colanic acid/amylovoran biosynthesis glycosyltransferase